MNLAELFRQLGEELGLRTDLSMVILTMALLLCRILPILFYSPFLGGDVVPAEVKMGIGLTLGIVLFPAVFGRIELLPTDPLGVAALMFKEVFIGFALAYIGIGFEIASIAGGLADLGAGSSMAQVHVPQIGERVTLLASLKIQLGVVLFLTLDGHHMVIEALAQSLTDVPLDRFPAFSRGSWPFFHMLLRAFADLLPVAFALAAPVLVATFLTDLALGMINRVAPQVQVFFISMQIKPMVAVLLVLVSMHLMMSRLRDELLLMLDELRASIGLLV